MVLSSMYKVEFVGYNYTFDKYRHYSVCFTSCEVRIQGLFKQYVANTWLKSISYMLASIYILVHGWFPSMLLGDASIRKGS